MKPEHQQIKMPMIGMANIQRNGTFSVVPLIAAGEITPEGLIAIGQVAKKYNLYIYKGAAAFPSLYLYRIYGYHFGSSRLRADNGSTCSAR